jgi:hypothetical protein
MSEEYIIGYASDLEGSFDYWRRYVQLSTVLELVKRGTGEEEIILKDRCHFVCGGDVCDRGDGDIRILRELISLKNRYEDRVHFILGNRDVNKLRLPFALHPIALSSEPSVYWVNCDAPSARDENFFKLNDRVARMKWILQHTMGAPLSFECRREELRLLGQPDDDESVVQSYLDLVRGDGSGLLTEYLVKGKLGVIINDVLFIHGAVPDKCPGWVPNCEKEAESPIRWCEAMQTFVDKEMQDYLTYCRQSGEKVDYYSKEEAKGQGKWMWDVAGGYEHPQVKSCTSFCRCFLTFLHSFHTLYKYIAGLSSCTMWYGSFTSNYCDATSSSTSGWQTCQ